MGVKQLRKLASTLRFRSRVRQDDGGYKYAKKTNDLPHFILTVSPSDPRLKNKVPLLCTDQCLAAEEKWLADLVRDVQICFTKTSIAINPNRPSLSIYTTSSLSFSLSARLLRHSQASTTHKHAQKSRAAWTRDARVRRRKAPIHQEHVTVDRVNRVPSCQGPLREEGDWFRLIMNQPRPQGLHTTSRSRDLKLGNHIARTAQARCRF